MERLIKGKVKWFNAEKGYGFINYMDESGEEREIFVHYSVIDCDGYKTLDAGQDVEFTIMDTPRGNQASYVRASKEVI